MATDLTDEVMTRVGWLDNVVIE